MPTQTIRVVGANDKTYRNMNQAVKQASVWLDAFGSVWITLVEAEDKTLHFLRDERGSLLVETTMPWRGTYYIGVTERTAEQDERNISRALENYGLT